MFAATNVCNSDSLGSVRITHLISSHLTTSQLTSFM